MYIVAAVLVALVPIIVICVTLTQKGRDWGEYNAKGNNTLPTLHIVTAGKVEIPTERNTQYINGKLTVRDAGRDNITDIGMEINVSGNGSAIGKQKPHYRVNFDKARTWFGMKSAKDWILRSNYQDATYARNTIAFDLAKSISRNKLYFQPSTTWCELYINGEYRGVYAIHEKIEAHESRININTKRGVIDTDYLLELSNWSPDDDGAYGNLFIAPVGTPRNYKYTDISGETFMPPALNDFTRPMIVRSITITEDQYYFARQFMTEFNFALQGAGDEWIEYVDLNTWIDQLIVLEIGMNHEVQSDNINFVKLHGGNKVYMSALWNLESTLGNYELVGYGDKVNTPLTKPNGEIKLPMPNQFWIKNNGWYDLLLKKPAFRDALRARWNEIRGNQIAAMQNRRNEIIDKLYVAAARDAARWGVDYRYINTRTWAVENGAYMNCTHAMFNWFDYRITWLDTFFNSANFANGVL